MNTFFDQLLEKRISYIIGSDSDLVSCCLYLCKSILRFKYKDIEFREDISANKDTMFKQKYHSIINGADLSSNPLADIDHIIQDPLCIKIIITNTKHSAKSKFNKAIQELNELNAYKCYSESLNENEIRSISKGLGIKLNDGSLNFSIFSIEMDLVKFINSQDIDSSLKKSEQLNISDLIMGRKRKELLARKEIELKAIRELDYRSKNYLYQTPEYTRGIQPPYIFWKEKEAFNKLKVGNKNLELIQSKIHEQELKSRSLSDIQIERLLLSLSS